MSDAYRDQADRTCVRCNVAVTAVNVIDRGNPKGHVGLAYTTDREPDWSLWSGAMTNAAGLIRAHICPRCHLVAFYAYPGEPVA